MKLALFDLDGTLIQGDSEVGWCRFLTARGAFDMSGIDAFMSSYVGGGFDADAFYRFQLRPLTVLSEDELEALRDEYLRDHVLPTVSPALRARLEAHRERGHVALAITAAHDFLAVPICALFPLDGELATLGERRDGRHTGAVSGTPCFGVGKITRLERWLAERGASWRDVEESWFYSDSHNDLPLLERVHHAVAVRPDPRLRTAAQAAGWEVVDAP
ncbi:MAG: HAD family phosphatase [Planctomycetes bacterium]|nr:HAD family phosphatase [Planctomycetota bacterium]